MSAPLRIAVYGTLMRAWPEHALLSARGATYAQNCVLSGTLYDLGAYPGLGPDADVGRVAGELFVLPADADLAALDAYEDYDPADEAGSLYLRRAERLVAPDVDAWVYRLNPVAAADLLARARPIAEGRWRGPRPRMENASP